MLLKDINPYFRLYFSMIFFDVIREIAYLCNIIQSGLFASWFPLTFSYHSVSIPLVSLTVAKGNKGFAKGMMGE